MQFVDLITDDPEVGDLIASDLRRAGVGPNSYHAYTHSIHQRIGLVAAFIIYFPVTVGHAKAIAVMAYPFYHPPLYQPSRLRIIYLPEIVMN